MSTHHQNNDILLKWKNFSKNFWALKKIRGYNMHSVWTIQSTLQSASKRLYRVLCILAS